MRVRGRGADAFAGSSGCAIHSAPALVILICSALCIGSQSSCSRSQKVCRTSGSASCASARVVVRVRG